MILGGLLLTRPPTAAQTADPIARQAQEFDHVISEMGEGDAICAVRSHQTRITDTLSDGDRFDVLKDKCASWSGLDIVTIHIEQAGRLIRNDTGIVRFRYDGQVRFCQYHIASNAAEVPPEAILWVREGRYKTKPTASREYKILSAYSKQTIALECTDLNATPIR